MRLRMSYGRILPSVLVLLVLTLGAQTTLDLSGDWVMTSLDAAVDVARELRVQIRTESRLPVMRIERRGLTGTRSEEYRIGIPGGHVTGTQQTLSSARWIGKQLVIRNGTYAGPLGDNAAFSESEESWSLDSNGRLLITTTTRERDAAPKTTQTTYRRR
jgi:hypothetical protein